MDIKVEKYFKVLSFVVFLIIVGCLCGCHQLTQEEINEQEDQDADYRASNTAYYEVTSVKQYVKAITNNFGGVVRYDICYCVTYLDNDGVLHTDEDFEDLPYCNSHLKVGDKDLYVIENYGSNQHYLYLTKATLSKFTGTQS